MITIFGTRTLGVFVGISIATVLAHLLLRAAANTGRIDTALWKWLELFVAPIALAFFTWYLEHWERSADRAADEQRVKQGWRREDERDSQQTYESCLDFVRDQLRLQVVDDQPPFVRAALVRARVLDALFRLENDSRRRNSLLQFLMEAKLLTRLDGEEGYPALDPLFRETSLAELKLPNANLQHVRFEKTGLSNVQFEHANLSHAWLEDVDATKAILRGAILHSTHCKRATLQEAVLEEAILTEAILSNANLRGAKMSNAQAERAQFHNSDLTGIDLTRATLVEANLEGASLKGANLLRADMRRADLRNANLSDAILDWTKLQEVRFNESTALAQKWRMVLSIVSPSSADTDELTGTFSESDPNLELIALLATSPGPVLNLRGQDLERADLSGAKLRGYDLTVARLCDSVLEGADLTDAILDDCDFANCSWKGARVRPEQLRSAKNVPPEWLEAAATSVESRTVIA